MLTNFTNLSGRLTDIYSIAMQGFNFKGLGLDTEFTIEDCNKFIARTDSLSFRLHMLLLKAICLEIEDEMFPIIFNCRLADMREYMTLMQMKINGFDIDEIFDDLDEQGITPDNATGIRDYFFDTYATSINEDVEYIEENNLDLSNLDEFDEYQYQLLDKVVDRNTSVTVHSDSLWTWTWLYLDTFSILFDERFNTMNPFILKEYAGASIELIRQLVNDLNSKGYDITTNTELVLTDKESADCRLYTVIKCNVPVKGIPMIEDCEKVSFSSTYTYNFNTPIIIR